MVRNEFENRPVVRFIRWIVNHKIITIVATLLLAFAAGSGARHLGFSNNYRVFFSQDNPQLIAFEELENTYIKNDNIIFIVSPKSKQVFTQETLSAVQELTKAAWQLPYSTRVDSLTNFQHTVAKGDDLFVGDLVPKNKELSSKELADIREIAINEPLLHNRIIRESSDHTGVVASIQLPMKDPEEAGEVVGKAREIRDDFIKRYPQVEIRLSGTVVMSKKEESCECTCSCDPKAQKKIASAIRSIADAIEDCCTDK